MDQAILLATKFLNIAREGLLYRIRNRIRTVYKRYINRHSFTTANEWDGSSLDLTNDMNLERESSEPSAEDILDASSGFQ